MICFKQKAIKLFINNTKFQSYQIKSVKQIHKGYTNISFVFILINNQKYQVRLANDGNLINRKNELAMLKNVNNKDFIYYDVKSGNAIKEWIDGSNPTTSEINTKKFLNAFSKQLNRIHTIKCNYRVFKHDFYEFIKLANNKLSKQHINKYREIVNKYKNSKLVLSHNDLSSENLIWNKKENKVHFIDYEWGRLNNVYWDVANFIKETNLNKKSINYLANINKLKLNILNDFIYVCINYAFQWTYAMPQTKKILTYRKKLLSKLQKYL